MSRRTSRRRRRIFGTLCCIGALTGATIALAARGQVDDPNATGEADPTGSTLQIEVPATLPPEREIDDPVVDARPFGKGLVAADVGCVDDNSADAYDKFFRERIGPSLAIDNPHVTELGGDRYLWLFNDAFLDYTGKSTTIEVGEGDAVYLENAALLQDKNCFSMIHRGTLAVPRPFEPGHDLPSGHFMWPLGGGIGEDGRIYLFWSEMEQDPDPGRGNGILRHPVRTWLGAYDPNTLERLVFNPAPNDDVEPQYGSVVQTVGEYSYLFGNSNMLNLGLVGGFYRGPFSGAKEYLARVPAGEFGARPEYYTGAEWSSNGDDAKPISERFYVSNAMQPRFVEDRWISVVKRDEFWGNRLVVDVADEPEGPWRTVYDEEYVEITPAGVDTELLNSYQPIVLPKLDANGDAIILVSQNARRWSNAVADPRLYRPRALAVELPE
jgi:hypothetical protein